MQNNDTKQIVGAIVLAGAMIAGALLIRGNSAPQGSSPAPIAKQVGLNVKKFDACVLSGKFKDKVQADIADGERAGVNGTPSSFIVKNGVVVDVIGGAQPFEKVMEQIADAEDKTEPYAIEPDPMVSGSSPVEEGPKYVEIRSVSPDDHIVGDINAKIIIVEYSDLECPFCKVFHATMHRVIKEGGGNIAWVYRHYPIPQLHPNAPAKAEETECAWEQGGNDAFWKYADTIFGSATQ